MPAFGIAVDLGRDDFSHRDLCLHRLLISALIRFAYQYGCSSGAVRCFRFFCRRRGSSSGGDGIFGAQCEDAPMHQLHVAEYPIILVEAMCIFMIAVSLITGTEAAQLAFTAFTTELGLVSSLVRRYLYRDGCPLH